MRLIDKVRVVLFSRLLVLSQNTLLYVHGALWFENGSERQRFQMLAQISCNIDRAACISKKYFNDGPVNVSSGAQETGDIYLIQRSKIKCRN